MKIKRFFAKDMRTALNDVKLALGADAVIMSNKRVNGGVEIVAAIDPDSRRPAAASQPKQQTPAANNQAAATETEAEPADSLQALLQRQAKQLGQTETATSAFGQAVRNQSAEASVSDNNVSAAQSAAAEDWFANEQAMQGHEPVAQQEQAQQQQPVHQAQSMARQPESVSTGNSDELKALQNEIAGIKNLLQHQVSGLMWQEIERSEPTRAMLIKRLQQMGLAQGVADQLSCFIPEAESEDEAWEQTLHILQGQVHTTQDDILTRGGVVALVGPTGVGKTTTVAKLAARYAQQHGADQVAMISTDTFRIGATEQLQTYGRIIGCPVKVARDARELSDILLQLRQKKLILIDTAGMSQRDIRLSEHLSTLMNNSRLKIRPYLVMSATAQTPVQQDILRQFKKLPLSGCILTKLDECMSLGEVLSVAIEHALPVSYVTDGQQVPEDIKAADAGFLVAEAERLYEKSVCSNYAYMTSSSMNV
ncbi:flagellar biosynthesis protein FlhF [Thalassospira xiamenensis]|nr:flagellar biosynthesis protein FlhF [Thalassospira xiamenensis]